MNKIRAWDPEGNLEAGERVDLTESFNSQTGYSRTLAERQPLGRRIGVGGSVYTPEGTGVVASIGYGKHAGWVFVEKS